MRPPLGHQLLTLAACAVVLQGCFVLKLRPLGTSEAVQRQDLPQISRHQGDKIHAFLGPDRIPAIDQPEWATADEATFMAGDEAVVGVLIDGQAKAYSLWHLDRHEIVNDWFGEVPVAVTW